MDTLRMDRSKGEQLPAAFTRLQARNLRSSTTRDKHAWRRLICTSPARLTGHVQPKASTSMVTIDEDEDGLQVSMTLLSHL